jgi:hypothetical protein
MSLNFLDFYGFIGENLKKASGRLREVASLCLPGF